jgi:hypothetical protein
MAVLRDPVPCSLVETDRRFRDATNLRNVCQFLPDYTVVVIGLDLYI